MRKMGERWQEIMDTSKEYIEMCRKARRFLWNKDYSFRSGSMFLNTKSFVKEPLSFFHIAWSGTWKDMEDFIYPIWQQDQLQDMAGEDTDYHTLMKFDTWAFTLARVYDDIIIEQLSFEQLWLCFVMHEKYGKKWDGKDWTTKDLPKKQGGNK